MEIISKKLTKAIWVMYEVSQQRKQDAHMQVLKCTVPFLYFSSANAKAPHAEGTSVDELKLAQIEAETPKKKGTALTTTRTDLY